MAKFSVGHHLEETATGLKCSGCDKTLNEIITEADTSPDEHSVCPTPHDEAEKGQVLRVG